MMSHFRGGGGGSKMTPKNRIIEGKNRIKGERGVKNDSKKSDIIYDRFVNNYFYIYLFTIFDIFWVQKTPIQHWWNMNVAYVVITVYYAKRLENHEIYQQKATDTILNLWIAYLSCSADLTSTQSNDSIQTKTFSTFLFTKDHFSLDKK